ncbi:MAG TPA: M48 family metallopeptidase [Longimicrobiaceae bacterium]|nr:M48 family metallopeptidase [Longimicrobiaceae bacterium]
MRHGLTSRVRCGALALALGGVAVTGGCAPAVTTQQEVQLGADYSRQINRQLPLITDRATNDFVNRLGRSIASRADQRGIPYTFYVVNSDLVNAFAIPGGYIYINRGVIERADNLSELSGVLAHEIGHVVERHGIEQMQRANNANTLLSVVYGVLLRRNPSGVEQAGVQVAGTAVFAGYGRDAEREADAVAIPYLIRAGISPNGLPTFFEELLAERRRNPSRVEQWFSTHPLTEERVANTRAAIAATPGATSASLSTDTREFQTFRARVRSLTPVPQDRR